MIRIGVVMDPIRSIKLDKDSTFAMLMEAQNRGWRIEYMEQKDLFLRDGVAFGQARHLIVRHDHDRWYQLDRVPHEIALGELDVILMRKDPPFDTEYVYTTYLLERAALAGALVVNDPRALRDANEKLFTAWFPALTPPTLVTRDDSLIRTFLEEHGEIVLKPLGGMGGDGVFVMRRGDPNLSVAIEQLSGHGSRFIMAQRYLPEIRDGDKRILLIDGEPVPYALARIPPQGETRGNLAAGGTGQGLPLSESDRAICAAVGPALRERGLLFVGLDVIGDRLTEINVTSPTCIRELDALYALNISGLLLDAIARRLKARQSRHPTEPNTP